MYRQKRSTPAGMKPRNTIAMNALRSFVEKERAILDYAIEQSTADEYAEGWDYALGRLETFIKENEFVPK